MVRNPLRDGLGGWRWLSQPALLGFLLGAASMLLIRFAVEVPPGAAERLLIEGSIIVLLGIACCLLGLLAARGVAAGLAHGADEDGMETKEKRRAPVDDQPAPSIPAGERLEQAARQDAVDRSPEGPQRPLEVTEPLARSPRHHPDPPAPASSPLPRVEASPARRHGEDRPPAPSPTAAPSPSTEPRGGLDPGAVTAAWQQYLEHGDGFFEPRGLRRHLDATGVVADVIAAQDLGIQGPILAIAPPGSRQLYLVPDFNQPARAVAEWFTDQGSGERMARIKRLLEVAVAERGEEAARLLKRGVVA